MDPGAALAPVALITVAEKISTAGAPGSQSRVGEAGKAKVAGAGVADDPGGATESVARWLSLQLRRSVEAACMKAVALAIHRR